MRMISESVMRDSGPEDQCLIGVPGIGLDGASLGDKGLDGVSESPFLHCSVGFQTVCGISFVLEWFVKYKPRAVLILCVFLLFADTYRTKFAEASDVMWT